MLPEPLYSTRATTEPTTDPPVPVPSEDKPRVANDWLHRGCCVVVALFWCGFLYLLVQSTLDMQKTTKEVRQMSEDASHQAINDYFKTNEATDPSTHKRDRVSRYLREIIKESRDGSYVQLLAKEALLENQYDQKQQQTTPAP